MTFSLLAINIVVGFSGAWFMARYAFQFGLVDQPNMRSSHDRPTPRGGGVGILIGVCLTGIITGAPLLIWLPAAGLSVVSFFDDKLDLTPRLRLLIQFLVASLVLLAAGWQLDWMHRIPLFLFFAFFIVGTANFYNFMDGINGIAGINGMVTFGLVALFAQQSHLPAWQVLFPTGIAAACLGFLPLNVPNARVFMGDVGSVLLGFAYASMVCLLTQDLAGFVCLISFLFMFYADTLTTLFFRFRDGERLSEAHRRHLYQVICNELGAAHWKVSCSYGLAQAIIGGSMLLAHRHGILLQMVCLGGYSILFLAVMLSVRASACPASTENAD
jgi:Fuc2NAc and GlcNAc transferase